MGALWENLHKQYEKAWKALTRALVKNTWLLSMPLARGIVSSIFYAISLKNGVVAFFDDAAQIEALKIVHKIKDSTKMILTDAEACQLFSAVQSTLKVGGDIAELGVYKGGSAKLICEAKGGKRLHLFDTFSGIPSVEEIDKALYAKGLMSASFDSVKRFLGKYDNVFFYKGVFPRTAEAVRHRKFSLVHFDADTKKSAEDFLAFFYHRLSRGGVIIMHDYPGSPGVKKAVDKFFSGKPEPVIKLLGAQCMAIKL